ncbi:hypothetical protein K474DRAFT_1767913 [Panus rudis PR-1116 ss-1]|nr:hypothetical protein K474DRAFT_1767913 [Panus rudis PR-1116 ss-1]
MKRLFGREKPKLVKNASAPADILGSEDSHYAPDNQYPTHPHYTLDRLHAHPQDRPQGVGRTSSDEHWDIVSSQDGMGSPVPNSFVPRAASPFSGSVSAGSIKSHSHADRDRDPQAPRKKSATNATAAIGMLRALDPHLEIANQVRDQHSPDDTPQYRSNEKKEKKGFWERASGRDKDKDKTRTKDRERERKEEENQAELTRMIGFLTATASEDWALVLEVCERASASEAAAKETAKALRREFKYAEPSAQLSAARLWAILLRNASSTFIAQCASRKFMDTLEEVITSTRTSPVVRERLLSVLAAAAYAVTSKSNKLERDPFKTLWRKLKAPGQPDEGIPFDADDTMFNPPMTPVPRSNASPIPPHQRPHHAKQKPSEARIIPPEEDIRRLFQECKVAKGNASLLSEALAFAKPEDLKNKPIIKEFYARCRASQELIYTQIPWASANAEKSRAIAAANRDSTVMKRKNSAGTPRSTVLSIASETEENSAGSTVEEKLLAALLGALEELAEAIRIYDDLERLKVERETEARSRKETRMLYRRPTIDRSDSTGMRSSYYNGRPPSPSPSPSPSPPPSVVVTPMNHSSHHGHPLPPIPHQSPRMQTPPLGGAQTLAPPPPAPHGPRSPSYYSTSRSRSPSPERFAANPDYQQYEQSQPDWRNSQIGHDHSTTNSQSSPEFSHPQDDDSSVVSELPAQPAQPSAKALGKRRVVEPVDSDNPFDPDDMFYEHRPESRRSDEFSDSDSDEAYGHRRPPVHYVYDAAAERTQQRIKEGRLAMAALVH